jgi:hypothetical protein
MQDVGVVCICAAPQYRYAKQANTGEGLVNHITMTPIPAFSHAISFKPTFRIQERLLILCHHLYNKHCSVLNPPTVTVFDAVFSTKAFKL